MVESHSPKALVFHRVSESTLTVPRALTTATKTLPLNSERLCVLLVKV